MVFVTLPRVIVLLLKCGVVIKIAGMVLLNPRFSSIDVQTLM